MKAYKDWLVEEGTYSILHRLLDKADRGHKRLQISVTEKYCPELYDYSDHDTAQEIWADLQQLETEANYLSIRLSRTARFQEDYKNATIILNEDQLETVRHWLDRPVFSPEMLIWGETVDRYADAFEDQGRALKEQIIHCDGKTPKEIVKGFADIKSSLTHSMTLRQLSARCFWGESKFLDHQEKLIKALYPQQVQLLQPRPILMTVYLPARFNSVLFIENQDTFLMLAAEKPKNMALLYLGGFRGTALRIREKAGCVFSYINNDSTDLSRQYFQDFWLGQAMDQEVSSYYWGDLDYAGMGILAALRYVFPRVVAWEPGYNALLEILEKGGGHSPGIGGKKTLQPCPDMTGCIYADNILLPAIEKSRRFLDQEAITSVDIGRFLL